MYQFDPNDPFTRSVLLALTAAVPAHAGETEAEYAERFTAAATAFAAFRPRDAGEQMLVVQIVGAQFASLDALRRAMGAQDPAVAEKQRRSFAAMHRTVTTGLRALELQQQRPAEALAPSLTPMIEPIPPLRLPPPEAEKPMAKPRQREKPRQADAPLTAEQTAKMPDEELNARLDDCRALYIDAMLDPNHPNHEDAMNLNPADFPYGKIPVSAEELDAERERRRQAG